MYLDLRYMYVSCTSISVGVGEDQLVRTMDKLHGAWEGGVGGPQCPPIQKTGEVDLIHLNVPVHENTHQTACECVVQSL